jgi:hypothetical protein
MDNWQIKDYQDANRTTLNFRRTDQHVVASAPFDVRSVNIEFPNESDPNDILEKVMDGLTGLGWSYDVLENAVVQLAEEIKEDHEIKER